MPLNKRTAPAKSGLRILLTNGRFPVSLDLCRQLNAAGHIVFTVDPMKWHVCKFSRKTDGNIVVPVPHEDSKGFIEAVKKAITQERIQMVIPMHEEVFYLAQDPFISPILFAQPFDQLLTLHNKWEYSEKMKSLGLDVPEAHLCKSIEDVKKLDRSRGWALKPTYGRATSGLHNLKPNEPLPEDMDVNADNEHIAQEWLKGDSYCTYGVALQGKLKAFCIYPVIDTIDGSSCVYFKSVDHPGIKQYVDTIVEKMNITGQVAFDFIEAEGRLVTIECNPRSTSGIHLFSKTNWLAEAFTNPEAPRRDAPVGDHRQLVPGMLMFQREHGKHKLVDHFKRIATSRDVIFALRDPFPAIMQPFLAISYQKRCHEKDLELAKMFQADLVWEPSKDEIARRDEHKKGMDVSRVYNSPASSSIYSDNYNASSTQPKETLYKGYQNAQNAPYSIHNTTNTFVYNQAPRNLSTI